MKIVLGFLVLTTHLSAADFKYQKPCNAVELAAELKAAGLAVDSVTMAGGACHVSLPASERRDPSTVVNRHVYVSPRTRNEQDRNALLSELAAIERKLDDGTASTEELRRALKLILKLTGLSTR